MKMNPNIKKKQNKTTIKNSPKISKKKKSERTSFASLGLNLAHNLSLTIKKIPIIKIHHYWINKQKRKKPRKKKKKKRLPC